MPGKLTTRLEQADVEVTSHARGRDEHPLCGLAESIEPAADQAPHALGKLKVFFSEAGLHARPAAEHGLRLCHVKGGLLNEKRIALRRCLDPHDLHGSERRFGATRDYLLDVSLGERTERDSLCAPAAQQT